MTAIKNIGPQLFIALALTIGCFYFWRPGCMIQTADEKHLPGNFYPWIMFVSEVPMVQTNTAFQNELPNFWQGRYMATVLSSVWASFFLSGETPMPADLQFPNGQHAYADVLRSADLESLEPFFKWFNTFGSYHALWLFATFVLLIVGLENPLVAMLGTFAGIICNAAPELQPLILPWDMPTMFFWTASYLAYRHHNWAMLIVSVFLGAFIKETCLVPALLLLGTPWKRWRQLAGIGALAAVTHVLNSLITPAHAMPEWWVVGFGRIWENLKALIGMSQYSVFPAYFVFANAGGLLLLVWCLFKRRDWPLRLMVLAYFIGELCGGRFTEFRIWFEVLPLGWILFSDLRKEAA